MKILNKFVVSKVEPEDKNIGWVKMLDDGTMDMMLYEGSGWESLITHVPNIDGKVLEVVGNLNELNTDNKTNVVNAINEINSNSIKGVNIGGDLQPINNGIVTLVDINGGGIKDLGIKDSDFSLDSIIDIGIYKYRDISTKTNNNILLVSNSINNLTQENSIQQIVINDSDIATRVKFRNRWSSFSTILSSSTVTHINMTSDFNDNNIDDNYVYSAPLINTKISSIDSSIISINEELLKRFPFTIKSFTGGGIYKKGTSATINLNWEYDGIPTSQRLDVNNVPVSDLQLSDRSKSFNYVSSNTVYKLTANNNVSRSVSVNFYNPKYIGIVTEAPSTESQVKSLTELPVSSSRSHVWSGDLNNASVCYCYPKSFGVLTSIKDANNFDYLNGYNRTELTVNGELYYIYTSSKSISVKFKQIFE